ncbi:MAG: excinuclease ABC subunit UvrC [Bacteroidales bacterium]|nr:excinuclease ABC subunit UvrC [Candidatus Latescibacterota bacterium]
MSSSQTDKLRERLKELPDSPGVYLMKDEKDKVIYVGKAKVLKNRVRSYFQKSDNLDNKTAALVSTINTIDYIATENEVEALMLENNLIKEYRPKYNVRLKDDKKYPFLKLTVNERFPRLFLTRVVKNDGGEYFGPYGNAGSVRRTLELIRNIFPLRKCSSMHLGKDRERECLNFQIGRCSGPCTGKIDEQSYASLVRQVKLFLKGKTGRLRRIMEKRMDYLSGQMRYEEASLVRDQIAAISRISERQHAVDPVGGDEDVISIVSEGVSACGVVMRIRDGRILGSDSFMIPDTVGKDSGRVMCSFLQLYYHTSMDIPGLIQTQVMPEDIEVLVEWLSKKRGKKTRIAVPSRGGRKKLVDLAEKNAMMKLVAYSGRSSSSISLLSSLKKTLGLNSTPFRIEAFDISNIQGTDAVGSMIVFENGKTVRSGYRHFRIRTVDGMDDFAMMAEVLSRRARTLKSGKHRSPDLIVIDGGRGQVNAAVKALSENDISGIPVVGLAKRNEEIHMAGYEGVIRLSRRNEVLRLLQRMRDEAHRFAVEYHRKIRRKKISTSELDGIKGIGEKRKIKLLMAFGSLKGIRKAGIEDIASIPGIGKQIAGKVYDCLHEG